MHVFESMLDDLPQAIAVFDAQRCCLFTNKTWQTVQGAIPQGVPYEQACPSASKAWLDKMNQGIKGAYQKNTSGEKQEKTGLKPKYLANNRNHWPNDWQITPITWHNQQPAVMLAFAIAEKSDNQIWTDDQFLYEKTQAIRQEGLWSVDIKTGHAYWSADWCALFDYAPTDIEANLRCLKQICHPEDQAGLFKALQSYIDGRSSEFYVEYRMQKADKSYVWTASMATWSENAAGDKYLIGIQRLIERQKEREQTMQEACKKADRSMRAKMAFLATMSHEIRTPLNGMMGMLELLSFQNLSEESQGWIKIARHSADALLSIVNSILDLSKLENGTMMLESRVYDGEALFNQAVNLIKPRTEAKGLDFDWSITGLSEKSLRGDPMRISQVIYNLLNNALKFTEKGFIRFSVDIKPIENDPMVMVEMKVEDSGIGIAEADRERIFDQFEQGDIGDERRFEGLGLGLSMTKRLLELMEGTISVTSKQGAGSCFTVCLPQHVASEERDALENPALLPDFLQKCHILVAEDNVINQKLISSFLGRLGLKADFVSGGAAAIDAACSTAYDLILMDVQMPGVSGLDATKVIRQDGLNPHIPIIAITANAFDSDRARCLRAGMSDFLAKPFGAKQLAQVIERQLGQTILGADNL